MSAPESTPSARRGWVVPVVVVGVVAAVLVAAALVLRPGSGDDESAQPTSEPVQEQDRGEDPAGGENSGGREGVTEDIEEGGPEDLNLDTVARRQADDRMAAGPIDAPVALVVFSDYQCPFCARWNEDTLPLMMEYADEGDLRIEWRDVNVFGDASRNAALASYAAAGQDRYWDYHGALFDEGETRSESELSESALIDLADELGLDRDRFAADMNSPEAVAQIDRNVDQGLYLGAHTTPVFLLGHTPIAGAQPSDLFVEVVEEELAKSGN